MNITGTYNLTGNGVFMGDSTTTSSVAASANSTIALSLGLQNNTSFAVSSGNTLTVSGPVVGSALATELTASGPGTLVLSGGNSYAGPSQITGGTLEVTNESGLGQPANLVSVASGSTLQLGPGAPSPFIVPQPVTVAGTVLGSGPDEQLSSPLKLATGGGALASTGKLTVVGVTGGLSTGSGLTINPNGFSGTVVLGGGTSNSYMGGTTVDGGTLNLDVVPSSGTGTATPGSLTVNPGSTVALSAAGQLDSASTLTVVGTGAVDLNNNPAAVTNLTLNSTSNTGAPTVQSTGGNGPLSISSTILSKGTGLPGVISAGLDLVPPTNQAVSVQTADSLIIKGTLVGGNLTLAPLTSGSPSFPLCTSGTSTGTCVALVIAGNSSAYAGTLAVGTGVLDLTGMLSTTPVSVQGGVLTGTGSSNSLTMTSGTLAPGSTVNYQPGKNLTDADSPGVLGTSSLALTGGTVNIRLDGILPGNGSTACAGYDQLNVAAGTTTFAPNAVNLNVVSDKGSNGVPCLVPSNGQVYTIISTPAESGNFNNYPETATVHDAATPYQYTISYAGGSGHSVTLTSTVNDTVNVTLSSGSNPSTYGEQLKFTASVVPTAAGTPTGTVAFTDAVTNGITTNPAAVVCNESTSNPKDNKVTLSGGTASCTPTTALPGGSPNTITATYSGDSTFTSNTGTLAQTVNPQPTTTKVTAAGGNSNPSTYGQQVTFIATITLHPTANPQSPTVVPAGTVTFFAQGAALTDCTALPVVTASGVSSATCNTSDIPTGNNEKITATYTGDTNYGTSTDSTGVTQTVNPAPTMTTLSNGSPSTSVFGQPVTFTATVSPATEGPTAPGGTVTFYANGSALADCTSKPVSSPPGGPTTATCATSDLPVGNPVAVTAVYNGDTNYASSSPSNTANQTVNQASTSTTLASSAPSGVAAGQQVTYTATVAAVLPSSGTTAPTGKVTFKDGNNPVACGTGTQNLTTSGGVTSTTCSVTYGVAIPAQHSITATYNGDTNYSGSSSSPLIQKVVAAGTTTAIARTTGSPNPSPNPSVYGQAVSFTATISPSSSAPAVPPGGTATFFANGTALADCTNVGVNGSGTTGTAVCNTKDLPVGNPVTVSSTYNGDSNYATSSSSSNINQTVNTAATSTAISVGSPNPSVFGQAVTFTATISSTSVGASSPAGTVMFSDGVIPGCGAVPVSTSNGVTTATCQTSSLPVGPSNVTASYSGDPNYSSSASASVAQTVNKATTAVTVLSDGNPSQVGDVTTYGAFIEVSQPGAGTPTGTVAFFDSGNPIANCGSQQVAVTSGFVVATCGVTYFAPGDHSITATYSGDGNFVGSNASAFIQRLVNNATPGGYWMVASDGGIFNFGPNANFSGSTGNIHLNAPIVGMAEDPATGGYWLVASDGGVFNFNAPYFGSTGNIHLNAPIVGITAAPDGNGYWLVASDGGIFNFGPSATLFGSTGNRHLNQPIVGMAAAPDGNGYWLVASDGGIFNFGPSATLFGSTGGMTLNKPVVGMAAAPDGNGYWLVASDGGIFNFGPSAQYFGSTGAMTLNKPIVGIAAAPDGNGYWLVASDGGIFNFGPSAGFFGSKGGSHLNQPIVGMAAAG